MPKIGTEPGTALLSTRQVADMLGKDVTTINRWAELGKLTTAVKAPGLRGARFFDRAEVEALAAAARPGRVSA